MKNKETILYIGGFELPDKNAAAQRVLNISKILKKLNYNVILLGLTKEKSENLKKATQIEKCIEYYEKKYPSKKINWLQQILLINKEIKLIKKIKNVKIVICYNYPAISLYRLKKYCNKHNIKILGDITEWYLPSSNWIKNIDIILRMKYVNKKLDGLICISRYLETYYKKINTVYIPGLVDKNDEKWKCKINKEKNKKIRFIFLGDPGKNCKKERLDLLIEAICKVENEKKDFKLIIAGVEKEKFEQNYKYLPTLKNYSKRVIYLGKIAHAEVIKELKKSDYSVIPRENQLNNIAGFPTKLGESLNANIPVIATDVGDIKEYIVDGENGYILKNCEVKTIQNKLEYLLKKRKEKKRIINKLDIENYLEKTDFFLKDINFRKKRGV